MNLAALDNARRRGQRPYGPVVLALAPLPETPEDAAVVQIKSLPADLRCLADLDVVIAAHSEQRDRAIELTDRCLRFNARDLELWVTNTDTWIAVDFDGTRYMRRVPPRW